jgi:hypothetical protein
MSWQSGLFGDGTYTLSLEVFNVVGNPLPAPAGNSLTLFIDNTAPVPTINRVLYDGDEVCTCGIVTQGDPGHGFTFDISYTDAHGALDGVSLVGIYGNNASAGVFSTQYSPSHVNEDGPDRWNGESNVIVGAPFYAPAPCAYSFILGLSSRVQNGYSRLFGPQYHVSLTILQGTGAGGIDTCLGGGALAGTLTSGSAASSVLPDAFSLRVLGGKSFVNAGTEAAGAQRPMGQQ